MLWAPPEEVADIVELPTKRPIEYLIRDQALPGSWNVREVGSAVYGKIFMAVRLSSFTLQNMAAGLSTLSWCEQYVIICHLWL